MYLCDFKSDVVEGLYFVEESFREFAETGEAILISSVDVDDGGGCGAESQSFLVYCFTDFVSEFVYFFSFETLTITKAYHEGEDDFEVLLNFFG